MFGFFLTFFSLSVEEFNSYVMHLTGLPPDDGNGYFVMIHGDGCGHCVRLRPTWNSAAEAGIGFAQFAELNCNINETACREIRTEALPRILYFKNGKIYEYFGMQLSRLLITWVSNFLNETAEYVTAANFTAAPKTAILFTEKHPKIWAAIESQLQLKDVKFYVSDDKELMKKLGVETFPGVYAIKSGAVTEFEGKLSVVKAVEFFEGLFKEKTEL